MAQQALKPWTVEQFFAWQVRQAERYELVDGFPLRMMAGASNRHDRIVANVIALLVLQLRGSGCRTFTGDGAVQTKRDRIRRPDAGVDCGESDPDGYVAAEPKLVVEVLSPSTRDFDTFEKLAEYMGVESVEHIVYVEPNGPEVSHWSRDAERAWQRTRIEGLDAGLEIESLGVRLPLAEIYDGVVFPENPRLGVRPEAR